MEEAICCKDLKEAVDENFVFENEDGEGLSLQALLFSVKDGEANMDTQSRTINNCPFCGIKLSEVM
jgi:hypothetical protein